jgi:hypothetical protein
MDFKKITFIFIITVLIVVLGYDGFVMLKAGYEASISHTIIVMAYKYPIMTFLIGMVCGHLFWRMGASKETDAIDKMVHGEEK